MLSNNVLICHFSCKTKYNIYSIKKSKHVNIEFTLNTNQLVQQMWNCNICSLTILLVHRKERLQTALLLSDLYLCVVYDLTSEITCTSFPEKEQQMLLISMPKIGALKVNKKITDAFVKYIKLHLKKYPMSIINVSIFTD